MILRFMAPGQASVMAISASTGDGLASWNSGIRVGAGVGYGRSGRAKDALIARFRSTAAFRSRIASSAWRPTACRRRVLALRLSRASSPRAFLTS